MRILIVSDTHGRHGKFDMVLEKEDPVDAVFHLGDFQGEEDYFEIVSECPVYMVAGNNDYYSDLPFEREVSLGGRKIFMAHGHGQQVYAGTRWIVGEGQRRRADIVMFGHTHRPYLKKENGMLVLNPGSLTYPRQENHRASYILMEMDESGEIDAEIRYM